jgi:hypothetical protein
MMPPQATAALWEGVRLAREKIALYQANSEHP